MRQGLVAEESTSLEDVSEKKNEYKQVRQKANNICPCISIFTCISVMDQLLQPTWKTLRYLKVVVA